MTAPKNDREGIILTATALMEAGYALDSVWDGEESIKVLTSIEAADAVMTVDDAKLYVKGSDGVDSYVYFVLGNAPEEVICDYTVNLSAVIDPLTDGWFE